MDWLNHHHLLYFWTIAKEGSVTKAAEVLRLAQPTLSAQVRSLEGALGGKLFRRSGRGLVLTELGRTVLPYAEQIFGLGQELLDAARGQTRPGPRRFVVGISDDLSKLAVHHLLKPALELPDPVNLVCLEDGTDRHLAMLLRHELDLVLTDAPLGAHDGPRAYNHLLGESGVQLFGTPELIQHHPGPFPQCLQGAPMLLPRKETALHRALLRWFEQAALRPRIVGEIGDDALLQTFGAAGHGFFPVPLVLAKQLEAQQSVKALGTVPNIRQRVYAISVERRIKHPAVLAIRDAAMHEVFA